MMRPLTVLELKEAFKGHGADESGNCSCGEVSTSDHLAIQAVKVWHQAYDRDHATQNTPKGNFR